LFLNNGNVPKWSLAGDDSERFSRQPQSLVMAMTKSASTSSLRVAGVEMSHIPRRATQHGIFLSSCEVPPTQLKPGQKSVTRQMYTEEAKELTENFMQADMPPDSIYKSNHSKLTKPEDYLEPRKPIIPSIASGGQGHRGVAHWKSTSAASLSLASVDGATYHRQHGPSYQAANPPACVGGGDSYTSYGEDYGKYGSDPRARVPADALKMPAFKTALTFGTAKGTQHIPGYQGFLATNTHNPYVARVENGGAIRSVDKTNISEQFHTTVPGYLGHHANHHSNDKGGVSITTATTAGRDYCWPARC